MIETQKEQSNFKTEIKTEQYPFRKNRLFDFCYQSDLFKWTENSHLAPERTRVRTFLIFTFHIYDWLSVPCIFIMILLQKH